MKNLVEYITEAFKSEELYHDEIKISWEKCGKKIADKWKSIPDELVEYMKQIIYNDINKFYENTPRKQKVTSACEFKVKFELTPKDLKDPVYKLINIYERVGMKSWMGGRFINDRMGIITGNIIGASDSRANGKDMDKIKFKDRIYNNWSWNYSDKLSGNGYNHLPGELQEEYRKKYLECITGAEIDVKSEMIRNFDIKAMVPCIDITYRAIYDKSKVNALIKEIMDSEELMDYAKSLDITYKGIDAYYSSKRSGDYTGD